MHAIAAGGGLAGGAFALELARHGMRSMIIERTDGPHHKVCGDFLSDKSKALLDYLGVDVNSLGGSRIAKLRLADRSTRAEAPLPFEALGLSRYRVDEALLDATARHGGDVLRATAVTRLDQAGDGVVVRTTRGDYRARVAALASGKHNIRGISRPGGMMVGFKIHLKPSQTVLRLLAGAVQLIAFPGGYVGLCLVEDGTLSIAWNIRRDVLRDVGPDWDAQAAHVSKSVPIFGDLVSGAVPAWRTPLAVSGLPYGFLRAEPIATAIYPVGDQLAVIPSFAGDGTALALESGIAAAHAVLGGEDACRFQRRMVKTHRAQFRLVRALDYLIASSALRRVAITVARASPALVTKLVAATRSQTISDGADSRSPPA